MSLSAYQGPAVSQPLPAVAVTPESAPSPPGLLLCLLPLAHLLLIALAFLAAIAASVFYVVYHPQRPSLSVSSLRLTALNLSATDLLTSRLDLSIAVHNPNRNLVFIYDDIAVSTYTDEVAIGEGTISGFALAEATVSSSGRSLDPVDASDLRKRKRYPLEIKLDSKAGVKIGGFASKWMSSRSRR